MLNEVKMTLGKQICRPFRALGIFALLSQGVALGSDWDAPSGRSEGPWAGGLPAVPRIGHRSHDLLSEGAPTPFSVQEKGWG